MKYLSVCSGIEAATVAWHPLGWQPVAFGEIEKFPCQVLAHHYPDTPNWGDMTKFKEWPDADVNVFVGGTPCQSFSVAGLRKGLDDPRGNLMLTYLAIAARYRPEWLVWENVPGVLSSNGGLDFASLLRGMGELGYGFAYRILDAQYFGVAQRRRRVFVVGYLGNWRPAAAVLFERHSLSGHPAPSRKAREGAAANAREGAASSRWPAEISSTLDTTFGTKQGLEDQHVNAGCPMFVPAVNIAYEWHNQDSRIKEVNVASTLNCNAGGKEGHLVQPIATHDVAGTMLSRNTSGGFSNSIDHAAAGYMALQPIALQDVRAVEKMQNGRGWNDDGTAYTVDTHATQGVAQPIPIDSMNHISRPDHHSFGDFEEGAPSYTLTKQHHHAVAQPVGAFKPGQSASAHSIGYESEMAPTLEAGEGGNNKPAVHVGMAVRRLTPKECERLQGFPDNYTDIKPKGKATPDGPRYKALGNSMAVPVMAWIGKRIKEVDAICQTQKQ